MRSAYELAAGNTCHAIRRQLPRDRPEQVNYTEAGKLLGVSRQTVANYARAGLLKLNSCGKVPIGEIDRMMRTAA